MLQKKIVGHPYQLAAAMIRDTQNWMLAISSVNKFAANTAFESKKNTIKASMEGCHLKLFQDLWTRFKPDDYRKRINQYIYRLKINRLTELVKEKKCVDFGCGHGNFAHALKKVGAKSVYGIDYGADSVNFCRKITKRFGVTGLRFKIGSVYRTGFKSGSFDFAIQNGVFHHLASEDRAYREVYRILKPGGLFWVYTDGSNSVAGEIQDTAARILSKQSTVEVGKILDTMGLTVGKRYHLGDSLQATYRHTNYKKLVKRLRSYGFTVIRRLKGGLAYDSDGEALKRIWSKEIFGSGDLRLLIQKPLNNRQGNTLKQRQKK